MRSVRFPSQDVLRSHSQMPFWFWNDDLSSSEIERQIDEFVAHGVHGFVIHPRVGLPRDLGWMSPGLMAFMSEAIEHAARRDMRVILYDEGMYPSGSCSGQIVAQRPDLACRGLACVEVVHGQTFTAPPGHETLIQRRTSAGKMVAIVDRPVDSYIRGLHYLGDGPEEDQPPMADILHPDTAALVIDLVHERFHAAFGAHFGRTIIGVFDDEPNPLGKCRDRSLRPGGAATMPHVNAVLGYDFTPHLPDLWGEGSDAARRRREYASAIRRRLDETWYAPLSRWCAEHGLALCGHPAKGDEIEVQRFFQIPGQDLVGRMVEMDKPSALKGAESTQAKASSSAMIHHGRRLNSNEFGGAYGPQTTFEEVRWLAWWCLVRGVNLLIPHAFFYSIRGPRKDERPPQIGPHSVYWRDFKLFADACARLCWVNTDSIHVCDLAILVVSDSCPWVAARTCFGRQIDFNYLDGRSLLERAVVEPDGVRIGGMRYRALVVEQSDLAPPQVWEAIAPMRASGRVVLLTDDSDLVARLTPWVAPTVRTSAPVPHLRSRHVIKEGAHYFILFNEGGLEIVTTLDVEPVGEACWIDLATGEATPATSLPELRLRAHDIVLLRVESA